MEIEVFKDIPGYEGLYQVSNLGNVRSLGNNGRWKNGKEIILKYFLNKGYCFIKLYNKGKYKTYSIHRLVGKVFLGDNILLDINHKNGIKTDNRLENLEYCTRQYNINHRYHILKTGLKQVIQLNINLEKIKVFSSITECSIELGIHKSIICRICKGNSRNKTSKGFIFRYV